MKESPPSAVGAAAAVTATERARARFLGVATVHAIHQASQLGVRPDAFSPWLIVLHVAAIPLAVVRPRLAMAAVAMLGIVQCVTFFPRTANHLYLGVVISLMLALLDPDDPLDLQQLRRSALALPLIVFAWSGLQKAIHGYWFSAEFLAWTIAARDDVAFVVRPLLDDATAMQLASFDRAVEGSGPYRLPVAWVLVSNVIWVTELGSPLLAVWSRTRAQLWWLLLAGTWAIQVFAHEVQFGLLFSNLLLCAAPPRAERIGRGLVVCALAMLVVVRIAS